MLFPRCLARQCRVTLRCAVLAVAGIVAVGAAQAAETNSEPRTTVIVVVGAAGEADFGHEFLESAAVWDKTCRTAGARNLTIGLDEGGTDDLVKLRDALAAEPKSGAAELWLVLLGHGTYDGREARFNLRGPDLTATQLSEWLRPFHRPLAIIDTAAASAPFINKLSAPDRVIVTSTRSGSEENFSRFGSFFSRAFSDLKADLDKDGQVSLLEAFLSAANSVAGFYQSEGRMMTEHALLDDTGDGLGTPSDWFRGVRAVKKADKGTSVDGRRAHQFHLIRSEEERQLPAAVRARRDELEMQVNRLRDQKAALPEAEYYQKLETLLLELAQLYQGPAKPTAPVDP